MNIHEHTAQAVFDRVRDNRAVLIDVREPGEFAAERLSGASLHPLSTFEPGALSVDPSREIILHCGSGKRSLDALNRCDQAGIPIFAHMKGGLMAWKAAGLPTTIVDPSTGSIKTTTNR